MALARNDGLQFARAVACLGVVFGHAAFFAGPLTQTPAPGWVLDQAPTIGVLLFFVLSGFLMGRMAAEGRTPARRFAWQRALRIYPAYWVAVVINVVALFLMGKPVPPPDLTYLALLPLNFGGGAYEIPAWTLIYESFFYLVVFGLIAAGARKRGVLIAALVWATAILGFHLADGWGRYHHVVPGPWIALSRMNLLFIAGMLVAIFELQLVRIPVLVLFLAAGGLWWWGTTLPPSIVPMLFFTASSVVSLIAFSRVSVKDPAVISLGNASYGIYLLHFIVLVAGTHLMRTYGVIGEFLPVFAVLAASATLVSWAFGALEYRLYQRMAKR